jgi:S1-C subfamily serine protease
MMAQPGRRRATVAQTDTVPMKKTPLISRSPRRTLPAAATPLPKPPAAIPGHAPPAAIPRHAPPAAIPGHAPPATSPALAAPALTASKRWRPPAQLLWALGSALLSAALVLAVLASLRMLPSMRGVSQQDIDAAVRESLEKEPLPSQAAQAYEEILPSVVRVFGLMSDSDEEAETKEGKDGNSADANVDKRAEKHALDRSLGSGVVVVDNGTILTNLHVVQGAKKVRVRFANGFESEASVISIQPENDLAVLKAKSLPDDLQAATMRSTADLRPGDHVIAVGHPFGIGPSVSYGVVSGLKREFRAADGEKKLSNLIQFDAAANPGNSGGPLVTMDGHVVGIVTAILNPSEQRTFIGIGFAVPIENAASAAGMPPF